MIHNQQQLEKKLFARKLIHIVVWNLLYIVSHHLHWWLYYLKRSLCFKYSLHAYNIKHNYYVVQCIYCKPFV